MKQAFKKVIGAVIFFAALSPLCAQGAVSVYADDTNLNSTEAPGTARDGRYESGSETEFSRSFVVGPGGSLSVNVDRGNIHVVGADQTRVQIQVVRDVTRASEAEAARILKERHVVLEQHDKEISITAREPWSFGRGSWWGWWRQPDLNVHYEITVPQAFDVRLKTAGGDVEVATLHGNVTANTEGGSLNFNGIDGKVSGQTEGGNVKAVGCRDEVQLRTEGGNVTIEGFTGTGLEALTEGGSVVAEFAVPPRSDCTLRTEGGNVTVRIPETAAVNLDARTEGGTTRTDLPVQVQGEQDRETLRGTINGGGAMLKLETEGGNIRVLKR
ncbi:MAG: DUF4097 family beta strand repeat-containing protein [Verrucomicrobiia bacterium]